MSMHNVELTQDLERFIEAGVESGRFGNAGEAVREGLALLKERELDESEKLEWLRAAAKEGFDAMERGDYTELHSEQEIEQFLKEIHNEAAASIAAERKIG
jgi:antitoxin ParD1/3/4